MENKNNIIKINLKNKNIFFKIIKYKNLIYIILIEAT